MRLEGSRERGYWGRDKEDVRGCGSGDGLRLIYVSMFANRRASVSVELHIIWYGSLVPAELTMEVKWIVTVGQKEPIFKKVAM